MMKLFVLLLVFCIAFNAEAFSPKAPKTQNPLAGLGKAAATAVTAATIMTSVVNMPGNALDQQFFNVGTQNVVAEKVVREGLYKDYEVDLVQTRDSAESTFKSAKETKSKKGKYTALLAVLVVGSFVIPMAQYFWYVRDDDSSDRFFADEVPEPPKKKGWFN